MINRVRTLRCTLFACTLFACTLFACTLFACSNSVIYADISGARDRMMPNKEPIPQPPKRRRKPDRQLDPHISEQFMDFFILYLRPGQTRWTRYPRMEEKVILALDPISIQPLTTPVSRMKASGFKARGMAKAAQVLSTVLTLGSMSRRCRTMWAK